MKRPLVVWYKLIGKLAVPCGMEEAALTFFRTVQKTDVGPLHVSTDFLSLDHSFGRGDPQLFETMIFDGEYDSYAVRTSTWGQAERAHEEAVAIAEARLVRANEFLG
jgi:hypothetical protein